MKELIEKWQEAGKKILCVYIPCTWPTVSRRFFESYVQMTSPEIAEQMEREHNVKMVTMVHTKFPIDLNRDSAVDRADREFKADYLQFLDADMVFPKDTIPRLFAHCSDETPVVTGVYWRKGGTMRCVQGKYSPWSESLEKKRGSITEQGFIAPDGSQTLYYKPLTSFDVVEPVEVTGLGCLLARMDVLKGMDLPRFKYTNGYTSCGDFTFEGCSEDMWFNSELRKRGVKIMCDPTIRCGHLVEKVIGCPEVD